MARRSPATIPEERRLDWAFFARAADVLAPALLGRVLVRRPASGVEMRVRLVEVEAYLGPHDRACHTYGFHRSPRVEAMYGAPGTAYVYFTYGMHHCINIVCSEPRAGQGGAAVLLRAGEPLAGVEAMRARRPGSSVRDVCRGPARLCRALGIDLSMCGASAITSQELFLVAGEPTRPRDVVRSARIGLGECGVWSRRLLRYSERGSEFVSRPA